MTEEAPQLEFVAALHVTLAQAIAVGETGHGIREVIPITGGTVSGPLLSGRVLPGGEDWALGLPDGAYHISARYVLALDDGTPVTVDNRGFVTETKDGGYAGRTTPRFEVPDDPHAWLRRAIFVGTLKADPNGAFVDLQFFRAT